MSASVLPIWIFVTVALAIALIAFGVGQIAPGAGMPFAAAAAILWVAYVATRARRMNRNG